MDDLVRKENSVCDDKEFVLLSVCLCLCHMIVFLMNVMWRRLGMCCKPIKITKKNVWTLTEVLWKKKRSRIMWIRSNIMLVCNRGIRINLVVCSPRLFFHSSFGMAVILLSFFSVENGIWAHFEALSFYGNR